MDKLDIQDLLSDYMQRMDLNDEIVAKKLGVTPKAVMTWRLGSRYPNAKNCIAIFEMMEYNFERKKPEDTPLLSKRDIENFGEKLKREIKDYLDPFVK